jgi:hypothetical protein
MSASASRRDNTDRSLARSAWKKRPSQQPSRRVQYDRLRRTTRKIKQGANKHKTLGFIHKLSAETGASPATIIDCPSKHRLTGEQNTGLCYATLRRRVVTAGAQG